MINVRELAAPALAELIPTQEGLRAEYQLALLRKEFEIIERAIEKVSYSTHQLEFLKRKFNKECEVYWDNPSY